MQREAPDTTPDHAELIEEVGAVFLSEGHAPLTSEQRAALRACFARSLARRAPSHAMPPPPAPPFVPERDEYDKLSPPTEDWRASMDAVFARVAARHRARFAAMSWWERHWHLFQRWRADRWMAKHHPQLFENVKRRRAESSLSECAR